jgi:tetratricopeptide (TPR) repeat protein
MWIDGIYEIGSNADLWTKMKFGLPSETPPLEAQEPLKIHRPMTKGWLLQTLSRQTVPYLQHIIRCLEHRNLRGGNLDGLSRALTIDGMLPTQSIRKILSRRESCGSHGVGRVLTLLVFGGVLFGSSVQSQQPDEVWQTQVRKYTDAHHWDDALWVVDQQIALSPDDMDIRAWRARVLTWAGRLTEAEQGFNEILKIDKSDPDTWMGLATVYLRQGRTEEALKTADHAIELDPGRADLRATRAEMLRASGDSTDAQHEFQRALALDPGSSDARSGLSSIRGDGKQELRFGFDEDLFSFTSANRDQWVTLVSKWTPQWTTSAGGSLYQRGGVDAGNFIGSVTRSQPQWGAVTIGGATGHDNGVIPETEAFFELDHGFKISEDKPLRGIEVIYGQHWYWYAFARILTTNETAIVYLPRDWTWSIELTEARSHFSDTNIDWRPSGQTRLSFPLAHWSERELSGNVFFAVGTEDFAQVDQIGSFASQTYGGGLRFRFTPRQDVTAYGAFQQRTQDRAQTSFGFSYGIRF